MDSLEASTRSRLLRPQCLTAHIQNRDCHSDLIVQLSFATSHFCVNDNKKKFNGKKFFL